MTPSPRPAGDHPTTPGARRSDRAAEAIWRRLCEGLSESWLDDIRRLRTASDEFDASLDIWSVALAAELKDADHRDTASIVLARLRKLSEEIEQPSTVDA